MYSNISNDAKNALKSHEVTTTARMTLTSNNTVIDGDNIVDIIITDQCYENGVIVGTAMCKEVEIELIDNNFDLADKEFLLEVGVLLPNNTYEYIPYGNFIVKDYQKIVSSGHYKLIAYDYMDKFNKTFEDTTDYSTAITLQDFYENVAEFYGVEIEEQENLPNANFIITQQPYFENMSGRVVLSRIAEMMGCFAKINRNNKLEMKLKTTTNEQFSRNEMNTSLEIDNKFGPINVIALRLSEIEGENVTKRDEESIAEHGETILQISDNPFVYTEALRLVAINDIYNQVDGFAYYPTTFNGKLIYLDCGDEVEVQDMKTDSYYKTIILKQTLKIPSTRNSKFENTALTSTGLEYQYTPEQVRKNRRTEYLVDKENQRIAQIIEEIGDRSQKTTTITEDIDGINSKVEEAIDLTKTISGIKTITITDGFVGENILELHIYGNNSVFDYLYPADDLYPSDTLYPYGDSRIRFYNSEEDKTIELGIKEVLRANNETQDEIFIDHSQVYLIRRVNPNGTTKTIEETTLLGTLIFNLAEGNNTFEIVNYSAEIEIKYATKNDYTDLFASKGEMHTEITQAKDNITTMVSETYETQENAQTKYTQFQQTSESIMAEVQTKVGEEELGTQIEQNYDSVKIAWNQISEYIKMMIFNSNTSLCILNEYNQVIASFDKNGEHFYEAGQTIPFGEIGVQKEGNNNYIAFSVDGEYSQVINNGMAWGIKTKSDNYFYPILYIKNFEMAAPNTDGGYGQLVLAACDILLEGLNTGIISGSIKMYGDPIGHALYFDDANGNTLFSMNTGLLSGGRPEVIVGASNYKTNLTVNGNIYADNFSSDIKLKKDVQNSDTNAIEIIKKIKHKQFKMKEDDKHFNIGYIAQELEKIDENFVIKREKTEKEEERYYINELPIIATLSKAIQEQQEQIENLQKEIRKLKEVR